MSVGTDGLLTAAVLRVLGLGLVDLRTLEPDDAFAVAVVVVASLGFWMVGAMGSVGS